MNDTCIFTVCVDNFHPEIAGKTIPAMEAYADKINADFKVIEERKFPGWSPTYEKMQVYELGKDYECNILIDCDLLLTKNMYDVREIIPLGYIGAWVQYDASITINHDEYIKLDGSDSILSTNFVLTRRDQHKLWEPLNMSLTTAKSRMKRWFVVDEYCAGRNFKKYEYKISGIPGSDELFHHYNITTSNEMIRFCTTC
jgi:hypothetical protein